MKNLDRRIRLVTEQILLDYEQGRYIDKTNVFSRPDRTVVKDILDKVQKIIFPGFFKAQLYRYYTLANSTSTLVEDVLYNLTRQISLTLRYCEMYTDWDDEKVQEKAADLSMQFLGRIPLIREYIETDLQAEFDGDPAAHSKAVAEGCKVYQVAAVALTYSHGGGDGLEGQHAGTTATVGALHVGPQTGTDVVELYLRVAIVQYAYGTFLFPGICGGPPEVVEVVGLR